METRRDSGLRILQQGDESVGWKHIHTRHIDGDSDFTSEISFFPTDQRLESGGDAVALRPIMTESEVQRSITQTIRRGEIDVSDTGDGVVYRCSFGQECYVPSENVGTIRVVTDPDGRVVTAYPEIGPNTAYWDPQTGWNNVD